VQRLVRCRSRRFAYLGVLLASYINKKAFLAIFLGINNKAFLKSNILLSFRATSLVLLDLEVVLLKLKVKPYTLTLLALGPTI
jgi:hypothetical protein